MSDKQDFDRLGELLPGLEGAAGSGGSEAEQAPEAARPPGGDVNQRVAIVWADVVGAEIAANAKPVQLREGRLVVTTSSSAWAQTLQLMSQMVIAQLNERLGEPAVERAVFRHAGWEDFSSSAPTAGSAQSGRKARRGSRVAGASTDGMDGAAASPAPPAPAAPTTSSPTPLVAPVAAPTPHVRAPVAHASSEAASERFTAEEMQALADLERLPLEPAVKAAIREAMKTGFRTRQAGF